MHVLHLRTSLGHSIQLSSSHFSHTLSNEEYPSGQEEIQLLSNSEYFSSQTSQVSLFLHDSQCDLHFSHSCVSSFG